MGFALWIDGDLAWAQGLHEYRPMGVAVIGITDVFRHRDFRARRESPVRGGVGYAGLFASLGEVNAYLKKSRSQDRRKNPHSGPSPTPAWI